MSPSVKSLTDLGKARASGRLLSRWSMALPSCHPSGKQLVEEHGDVALVEECGGKAPHDCPQKHGCSRIPGQSGCFGCSKHFGCSRHSILFCRYGAPVKLYVVVCQIKNNCTVHPLMQLIFKRELLVVVILGHAWLNTISYHYACISLNICRL